MPGESGCWRRQHSELASLTALVAGLGSTLTPLSPLLRSRRASAALQQECEIQLCINMVAAFCSS
jgi:hypothetical protein